MCLRRSGLNTRVTKLHNGYHGMAMYLHVMIVLLKCKSTWPSCSLAWMSPSQIASGHNTTQQYVAQHYYFEQGMLCLGLNHRAGRATILRRGSKLGVFDARRVIQDFL